MNAVIATEGLTKRYGGVSVVDAVSLTVGRGDIYGIVGLNGAGKTTMMRMLLGMIRPTAGRAFLFGEPVHPGQRHIWARVGYVVETPRAYPELTVAQNLEVMRRLRGVTDARTVDRMMDRLRLARYRHKKAGVLSTGNRQRLALAKALLHDPEVLLLDEPTNGLDPAGIAEVRDMLATLAADDGVTVFLASHLLPEVGRLITRLGIIHEGRLVEDVDAASLDRLRRRRLAVRTRDAEAGRAALQRAGFNVERTGDTLYLGDSRAVQRPDDVARLLVEGGVPPVFLRVEEEDLEAYFLRVLRGAGGT